MPKSKSLLSRVWDSAKSGAKKLFGLTPIASNKINPEPKVNSHEEILEFLCNRFVSKERRDEGVFRKSINQRKLDDCKKQILTENLKGENPHLLEEVENESYALGALIKPFFKEYIEKNQELKKEIITMLDSMTQYTPDHEMKDRIVQLFDKYPVVKKVAESFVHAEKFNEENKMTFKNLAIVLGPNLFDIGLEQMQKAFNFAQFLLETTKEINEQKQKASRAFADATEVTSVATTAKATKFDEKKSEILRYLDLSSQSSDEAEAEIKILEQSLGTEIIDKLFYAISDRQQTQNGAEYSYLKISDKLIEEAKKAIALSQNDDELELALAPSFTNQAAPEAPPESESDSGIESEGENEEHQAPSTNPSKTSAHQQDGGNLGHTTII